MVLTPSIGDILTMSQMAWKIGRAFSKGNCGARSEFGEVEREAGSLSEALKVVAETLCDNDSVLIDSPGNIRAAFGTILESAQRTLSDLESFIQRFQVLKKTDTAHGFTVERTWSKAVLLGYKTLEWTTEGGTIDDLRSMLHLHAESINLTLQALQSGSLARLERTIVPTARTVASIHEEIHGQLGPKIDDIHRLLMAFAMGTPFLDCRRNSALSTPREQEMEQIHVSPLLLPRVYENTVQLQMSKLSPVATMQSWHRDGSEPGDTCVDRRSVSLADQSSTVRPQYGTVTTAIDPPPENGKSLKRGDSGTLARTTTTYIRDSALLPTPESSSHGSPELHLSNTFARTAAPEFQCSEGNRLIDQSPSPATPASLFLGPTSSQPRRGETSVDRAKAFEQAMFRNSAILCDVRATSLEYAKRDHAELDPRYDTEMVEVVEEARLYVVRRHEQKKDDQAKVSTAIWTLATDGSVRARQKLPEVEIVPYCSCFETTKVSIPTVDGERTLRFYSDIWDRGAISEISTTWTNYFFASEEDAIAFQSAVYGRRLIGSFRTVKTTVLHEGFMGAFAFEEQFANIEMLRVWEDDGTAMPGAAGGVQALLHISSTFGKGYARWWLNNSRQPVRAKDDGMKFVKIKGLDLHVTPQDGPGPGRRRSSGRGGHLKQPERRVEGVRIEFKCETEKQNFLALWKRAQATMYTLPPL